MTIGWAAERVEKGYGRRGWGWRGCCGHENVKVMRKVKEQ